MELFPVWRNCLIAVVCDHSRADGNRLTVIPRPRKRLAPAPDPDHDHDPLIEFPPFETPQSEIGTLNRIRSMSQ